MIDVSKLKDRKLKCCDCENDFAFEAREQAFYLSKGLAEPKRCKLCRTKRRATLIRYSSQGVF